MPVIWTETEGNFSVIWISTFQHKIKKRSNNNKTSIWGMLIRFVHVSLHARGLAEALKGRNSNRFT